LVLCKRHVWENYVARERGDLRFRKFQKIMKFSENLPKLMYTAQNQASGVSEVIDFVEHVLKGI